MRQLESHHKRDKGSKKTVSQTRPAISWVFNFAFFAIVFKKREIKSPRIKILANAFNTHIENRNHKKIIFRN